MEGLVVLRELGFQLEVDPVHDGVELVHQPQLCLLLVGDAVQNAVYTALVVAEGLALLSGILRSSILTHLLGRFRLGLLGRGGLEVRLDILD